MQPNEAADRKAAAILADKGVCHVQWAEDREHWRATAVVKSSGALNRAYCCTVHPPEAICCDCMDFRSRGGLCKHLRAAFTEVMQLTACALIFLL